LPAKQLTIVIAPLGEEAPAIGEILTESLTNILGDSPLASVVVRQESLPDGTEATDLASSQSVAGADLLIVWGEGQSVIPVYISGMSVPPLSALDQIPEPLIIPAPGAQPLFESTDSDMSFTALLSVGLLEVSAGYPDAASFHFQQLQTLPIEIPFDLQQNNQEITLFALAIEQASRGNNAEALRLYSQALRGGDKFIAALMNRGSAYLLLGDSQAALSAFTTSEVIAAYPVPAMYGQTLAHLESDAYDDALESANNLMEQSDNQPWALNLRGIVNTRRGDYEGALLDFKQISDDSQDSIALFNQARLLRLTGRLDDALALYDTLLDREPSNVVYYLEQALTYRDAGKVQQAKLALNRAIDLGEDYEEAFIQRGLLNLAQEEYEQAHADGLSAQEIDPLDGRADAIIGESLLKREEFAAAEDALTSALEKGEATPTVYANRAWSRHRQRLIGTAIDDYEQALSLGMDDATLLLRLGFALIDADREEDALNVLLSAVNDGLDTPEAHAGLSLALDMNLRRSEAEAEYQKALDLDKSFGDEDFLAQQVLWSQRSITRARTILNRLEQ
jgi:tetratricopeptide (TPR) repeat protein